MRRILALAWNVIRTELSDRSSIVFLLILPLVFTYVIGLALGGDYAPDPNADTRHPVVVVDQDQSDLSERLFTTMENSQTIRPVLRELADAIALLDDQQISAYIVIPSGFGDNLTNGQKASIELETAAGDNYALATGRGVAAAVAELDAAVSAAQVTTEIMTNLRVSSLSDDELLSANLDRATALAADAPLQVSRTGKSIASTTAIGFAQASPGQLVTWVLITLLGSSVALITERTEGTLNRLMAAPMRRGSVLAGIILGRLALGLVQIVILIGFGALILGVNWGSSYAGLAVLSLCFALAAVALGLLLGVFCKTSSQARELTTAVSMITAALGGAWWPMEITPQLYQSVVKILPTTWAMQGFTDVIVRGQGVAGILLEALVLIGFALLFFTVSIRRFRYE